MDQAATNDTVTTKEGTTENVSTALTPFWKSSTEFYTSTDVRTTESFGNAYPETQPWNFQSTGDYQASVRTAFRNLYGGSNLGFILANSRSGALSSDAQIQTLSAQTQTPQAESKIAQISNQAGSLLRSSIQQVASISASVLPSTQHGHDSKQVPLRDTRNPHDGKGHNNPKDAQAPKNPKDSVKHTDLPHEKNKGASQDNKSDHAPAHQSKSSRHMKDFEFKCSHEMPARKITDLAPDGKYLEWITNVKVQKHGLDGTFFVHIFLGEFNRDDPLAWRSDPNLVGTLSVLGENVGTGCKKCKKDREDQLQITGQVPLTLALTERYLAGQIEGLTPQEVIPYLQTNLHWRVAAVSFLILVLTRIPHAFTIYLYFHAV